MVQHQAGFTMEGGPVQIHRRREAIKGKSLSPLRRRDGVIPRPSNVPQLGRRALSEVALAAQAAAKDGINNRDGPGPITTHLRKAIGKLKPPNQAVISDVVTRVLELSDGLRVVRRQVSDVVNQVGNQGALIALKQRIEKLEDAQEDCNSAWAVLQEKGCPICSLNGLNGSLKFQDAPNHDEGPLVESGSREVQLTCNPVSDTLVSHCHQEVDRLKVLVDQLQTRWQESEQQWQEAAADESNARRDLDASLAMLKAQASQYHAELRSLGDEAAHADGERQELRTLLTSLQEGQVEVIRHLQGALDVQENHRTQLSQQQRALEVANQERAALRAAVERVEASTSLVTGKLAYLIHTS